MRTAPANALPPGRLTSVTCAEQWMAVQARIIHAGQERWVRGSADAWTSSAVCVWWTDTDSLRRIDWLPARDVKRL